MPKVPGGEQGQRVGSAQTVLGKRTWSPLAGLKRKKGSETASLLHSPPGTQLHLRLLWALTAIISWVCWCEEAARQAAAAVGPPSSSPYQSLAVKGGLELLTPPCCLPPPGLLQSFLSFSHPDHLALPQSLSQLMPPLPQPLPTLVPQP